VRLLFRDVFVAFFSAVFGLPTRLAWLLQECPAFLIPAALAFEAWNDLELGRKLLLLTFMLHYFQRSFVFPFLIAPSNPKTPFLPSVMAFIFCSYNGFMQSHALIAGQERSWQSAR